MGKLRSNNKSVLMIAGIIAMGFFLAIILYVNVIIYYTFTWPSLVSEWLEKFKEPLRNSQWLRVVVTIGLLIFSYFLYRLKKGKIAIVYGCLEIAAGVYTVYYSFQASFESDILYALGIGGGIFLMTSGVELYIEEYKKDEANKKVK